MWRSCYTVQGLNLAILSFLISLLLLFPANARKSLSPQGSSSAPSTGRTPLLRRIDLGMCVQGQLGLGLDVVFSGTARVIYINGLLCEGPAFLLCLCGQDGGSCLSCLAVPHSSSLHEETPSFTYLWEKLARCPTAPSCSPLS